MKYIIFDLEATCWEKGMKYQNETIEIGAVKINEEREIESEFQRFVKPIRFPILSNFCKDLTSINQEQINSADHFYKVVEEFKNWFDFEEEDYVLCSWGFYDKSQLINDCQISNLEDSWVLRHISLKHQFRDIKNLRRAIGMTRALEMESIPLEGTHHRGIDDARNISKIFLKYFDNWKLSY